MYNVAEARNGFREKSHSWTSGFEAKTFPTNLMAILTYYIYKYNVLLIGITEAFFFSQNLVSEF